MGLAPPYNVDILDLVSRVHGPCTCTNIMGTSTAQWSRVSRAATKGNLSVNKIEMIR